MRKIWITLFALLMSATPSMAGDKGVMGALLGAGIGAGIGHAVDRSGGSGKGAVIGAIGGYIIGKQMDKSGKRAKNPPAQPQTQTPPPVQSSAQRSVGGDTIADRNCTKAQDYLNRSLQTGNNSDKIYYLEKATRLCPGNARMHNDLGVAYYTRSGRHDRERARDEFQTALKIKPDYTVARDNLGSL